MKPRQRRAPAKPAPTGLRSSAVARLAQMPVATLRTWEQRYQAVKPATTLSGHRLYSPDDVQRVLLLRQLTEQGHGIGSMATLDAPQLQRLLRQVTLGPVATPSAPRWVVVGPALAARLQRPALSRALISARPPVAVFASLADAASAGATADLMLWHAPELLPAMPPELQAARQACGAPRLAVVYRYAGAAARQALTDVGAATLREPADDAALGVWLSALLRGGSPPSSPPAPAEPPPAPTSSAVAPRRYDDAALTTIAGLSPTLACECPRHVAELLMQLSSFEAYSAACIHRDAADAQLHAYLLQVAGASRALFESALERLARHEGLPLR